MKAKQIVKKLHALGEDAAITADLFSSKDKIPACNFSCCGNFGVISVPRIDEPELNLCIECAKQFLYAAERR